MTREKRFHPGTRLWEDAVEKGGKDDEEIKRLRQQECNVCAPPRELDGEHPAGRFHRRPEAEGRFPKKTSALRVGSLGRKNRRDKNVLVGTHTPRARDNGERNSVVQRDREGRYVVFQDGQNRKDGEKGSGEADP